MEVEERVTIESYRQSPTLDADNVRIAEAANSDSSLFQGISGHILRVLKPLNTERLRSDLQNLYDEGFHNICVCLAHSYTFQGESFSIFLFVWMTDLLDHELAVQKIAEEIGFSSITLSCLTLPMIKMLSRGMSATADAYLTPIVQKYIQGFQKGFSDRLQSTNTHCEFMQSHGGLVDVRK